MSDDADQRRAEDQKEFTKIVTRIEMKAAGALIAMGLLALFGALMATSDNHRMFNGGMACLTSSVVMIIAWGALINYKTILISNHHRIDRFEQETMERLDAFEKRLDAFERRVMERFKALTFMEQQQAEAAGNELGHRRGHTEN